MVRRYVVVGLVALYLGLPMGGPTMAQDPPTQGFAPQEAGTQAPATSQPADAPQVASDYRGGLRKMEEDIVDLKERVYNTKTRLVLLKERILADVVSGSYAIILHRNRMSSSFALEQVHYHINGKSRLYLTRRDADLDSSGEIVVHSGALPPGSHVIDVEMIYSGRGRLFTYMKGYQFRITSRHVFYATEGRITKIESIGYERGDFTYSIEERPSVKFQVDVVQFSAENLARLTGQTKTD